MSAWVLALSLLFWSWADVARAGDNPHFTIPLHAKVSSFEPCNGYLPVNCLDVRPTVEVATGEPVAIFVFVMNHTKIAGLQTAFEVDSSWTFAFGLWDCQHGMIADVNPQPPFGPTAGTVSSAFFCVTSAALESLGRMFFVSGQGCIGQVQSSFPFGICALDCDNKIDQILPGEEARLGRVCVGPGGRDACDQVVPTEPTTWGLIKATYR